MKLFKILQNKRSTQSSSSSSFVNETQNEGVSLKLVQSSIASLDEGDKEDKAENTMKTKKNSLKADSDNKPTRKKTPALSRQEAFQISLYFQQNSSSEREPGLLEPEISRSPVLSKTSSAESKDSSSILKSAPSNLLRVPICYSTPASPVIKKRSNYFSKNPQMSIKEHEKMNKGAIGVLSDKLKSIKIKQGVTKPSPLKIVHKQSLAKIFGFNSGSISLSQDKEIHSKSFEESSQKIHQFQKVKTISHADEFQQFLLPLEQISTEVQKESEINLKSSSNFEKLDKRKCHRKLSCVEIASETKGNRRLSRSFSITSENDPNEITNKIHQRRKDYSPIILRQSQNNTAGYLELSLAVPPWVGYNKEEVEREKKKISQPEFSQNAILSTKSKCILQSRERRRRKTHSAENCPNLLNNNDLSPSSKTFLSVEFPCNPFCTKSESSNFLRSKSVEECENENPLEESTSCRNSDEESEIDFVNERKALSFNIEKNRL